MPNVKTLESALTAAAIPAARAVAKSVMNRMVEEGVWSVEFEVDANGGSGEYRRHRAAASILITSRCEADHHHVQH
jgi:hypothetical protein